MEAKLQAAEMIFLIGIKGSTRLNNMRNKGNSNYLFSKRENKWMDREKIYWNRMDKNRLRNFHFVTNPKGT
jgi:hypothetical protein